MSENSKIEWTDHTFNPWIGCTKVSPGCAHCYAEALDKRWQGGVHWGQGAPRKLTSDANWRLPLRWNRDALALDGKLNPWCDTGPTLTRVPRTRVFCASLADWLDEEVPIEWLARLLALIHATPHLDWLLLTKRPGNWSQRMIDAVRRLPIDYWVYEWIGGKAPANVWIGTTVEDQARAEERIPQLLDIPARVRFLSCEPLLGALNLEARRGDKEALFHRWFDPHAPMNEQPAKGIDWVICGGESGPGARPMHPDWARSLRDQCAAAARTPFFFKQWGEYLPEDMEDVDGFHWQAGTGDARVSRFNDGTAVIRIGKKRAGRTLDDIEHNAFPSAVSAASAF